MTLGQFCFRFPCQFSFQRMLHTHLPSVVGTADAVAVGASSGLGLAPSHELQKSLKVAALVSMSLEGLILALVNVVFR
jgi:hypothetical protein